MNIPGIKSIIHHHANAFNSLILAELKEMPTAIHVNGAFRSNLVFYFTHVRVGTKVHSARGKM